MSDEDRAALRRAWVDAANALIADPDADVLCLANHDAKPTATFVPADSGTGGELVITCPGCGAEIAVRVADAPAWRDRSS